MRNSYLSILPDDSAGIFTAPLLISYFSVSPLCLSSIITIEREELSDKGLVSIIKKEYVFTVNFSYEDS